jgi:hypothetical protein
LAAAGAIAIAACNSISNLGSLPDANNPTSLSGVQNVSEGRLNAARVLHASNAIYVDILQFTGGLGLDPADGVTPRPRDRCFPLGQSGVFAEWVSTIGGPVPALDPDIGASDPSEYDFLTRSATGETDYILSIRSIKPDNLDNFTALEFSFRSVNPLASNHAVYCPPSDYGLHEADFPSNDDTQLSRSLVDMTGGDVAIVAYGIRFDVGGIVPSSSAAFMNFLGPNSSLLFMRDNALQSGRFYAIAKAVTGRPGALSEPGAPPSPGFFQSVQVTGPSFDGSTEPFANVSSPFGSAKPNNVVVSGLVLKPRPQMCVGGGPADLDPGVGVVPAQYSFADLSHVSNVGATGGINGGLGGFVTILRNDAFQDPIGVAENVVLDPSANPGLEPANANQIPPPPSGYFEQAPIFTDKPACPPTGDPDLDDHSPTGTFNGPPGCHEIGVTVFFIHS